MEELYASVRQVNTEKVKEILYGETLISEQQDDLFNVLIAGLLENPSRVAEATKLVYLLRNAGLNVNQPDVKDGSIALLTYFQNAVKIDAGFVEALLRCNADVYAVNHNGINVLDELARNKSSLQNNVKEIFEKYMPGMWNAVENDDLMSVRRLVNQWCRTDIEKNGKTLVQLSIERGVENMDRLVGEINSSMDLAHGVLADDITLVNEVIDSKKAININFRNGGDRGATPLYYALCNDNKSLTEILLANGARLDTSLSDAEGFDFPLLFAVLINCNTSPVSPDLIEKVIPDRPEDLNKLFYKGQNVLFHSIDYLVPKNIVEVILKKGCASLVTAKNKFNLNAREYAAECDATYVVEEIDKAVFRWCFEDDNNTNRKLLALHGYQYLVMPLEASPSEDSEDSLSSPVSQLQQTVSFFQNISKYEEEIKTFVTAVVNEEVETAEKHLIVKNSELPDFECCLADARYKGDGQPVLHKAVLRCNVPIVRNIAHALVCINKIQLDSIRDSFYRTALHYAYGMTEDTEVANILLDYGCSEFTVDKDGRSPLSFKDRRNQKLMADLLTYQLSQNYSVSEPNPWASPLPLPVIGYLMDCQDSNHLHKLRSSRMKALSYQQPSTSTKAAACHSSSSSSSGGDVRRGRLPQAPSSSSCERFLAYPSEWSMESSDDDDSETSEREFDISDDDDDDDAAAAAQAEKRNEQSEGRWNYMSSYASYASPYCSIL